MNLRPLEFHKKNIVVMGLGISGLWITRYLMRNAANVTISENSAETKIDPEKVQEVRALGAKIEFGGHSAQTVLKADMIIISPGVPHNMPLLRKARAEGIHVTGELELASRLIDIPIVAITGTNGKSTVTQSVGLLLKNAGLRAFVGGNIGTPLMAYAAKEEKADYAVIEVSSFQLDTIETFCPFVSVILNISPDHLDRYPVYEDYLQSKLKIFSNQKKGQHVILNDDDESLASIRPFSGASVLRYGLKKKEGRHAYIQQKNVMISLDGNKFHGISYESYLLPGRHNLENLMAVLLIAQVVGIDPAVIRETIAGLKGLPNRMEHVKDINGVSFYNDSKATNVDASVGAISDFDRPLILIAGGRHKGADYTPLVNTSQKRVKKAVFLGEAKGLLSASFEGIIPYEKASDMNEAVSLAVQSAESGDVVLLSPACSSFDMFSDYAHRGRVFRTIVERLGGDEE